MVVDFTGNLLELSLIKSAHRSAYDSDLSLSVSHTQASRPKEQTSVLWSKGHEDLETNGRKWQENHLTAIAFIKWSFNRLQKSGWGWRTQAYVVSESLDAGRATRQELLATTYWLGLVEVIGLVLFLHLKRLEFHFLRNVKGDLRKPVCEWKLTCREHCQVCFSCLKLCLCSRGRFYPFTQSS